MNKSYKIKLDPLSTESNEIKINLEQDVETLEFLSMSLDTKEIYGTFNADYGVLVGRVVANGGVGIPNAKISIFIPLSEEDENDRDIRSIYPYKRPNDKNFEGKRYNLLPRVSQINPNDGLIYPRQPFGSFPIKPEIVTNPKLMNVYKKYYKYTATTNDAGDYMIFGVPVGVQTVHMSVDITDIGEYSMTPASMVGNLGYSPNLFTDNNSRIKESNDLDDLPHIETQEISVDVIPFWGDVENFQIGVTQQNFRIRATLINTFTIFGTVFTDGEENQWGGGSRDRLRTLYRAYKETETNQLQMVNKRISRVTEKIYYYPNTMTDGEIENAEINDPEADNMLLLDPSEYSVFKRDGDFVVIVSCNRRKIITDEFGNEIEVDPSSPEGVFTEFKGFMTIEYSDDDLPTDYRTELGPRNMTQLRMRFKFPQKSAPQQSHAMYSGGDEAIINQNNARWRHEHYTFTAGNVYSVSKFHPVVYNNYDITSRPSYNNNTGFFSEGSDGDLINFPRLDASRNVGIIISEIDEIDDDDENNEEGENLLFPELPSNTFSQQYQKQAFAGNWLNFAVYLPQIGYLNPRVNSRRMNDTKTTTYFSFDSRRPGGGRFPINENPFRGNTQKIAAGQINTAYFGRSDLHWTDFIKIPKNILTEILNKSNEEGFKGFTTADLFDLSDVFEINQNFKSAMPNSPNGEIPFSANTGAGRVGGIPTNGMDLNVYIYRGWRTADCLQFLRELNII